MGRGALRNRRFARPFHGVRVEGSGEVADLRARAHALSVRMESGQVFSHLTAAALHGFPLPARHTDPRADLHISVFEPQRAPQLRGVVSHELKATGQLVTSIERLAVMGVEDTWAQLASSLSPTDLVVVADWLVTGREPYSGEPPPTTIEALDRAIARRGRMRGVKTLRVARDRARYGSLSPQETRLRLLLQDEGFPEPALNHRIMSVAGELVAMVDLAYPDRHVAIEYLGDHHRTDPHTYRDDILRRERLTAHGWATLFVTAHDLHAPAFLLVRLRRLLASTGKVL